MAGRGDELIQSRLEKLARIKRAGINPYPSESSRIETIVKARDFDLGTAVTIAGRLMSMRGHGGATFADLRDATGQVQLFFKKDILGDDVFEFTKNFDLGDFITVTGNLFKTQAGEVTVEVTSYLFLTKAIRPLPSEFYGVQDIEIRLRKRYLDLLLTPELKDTFIKKSKFWQAVRSFLIVKEFIEVETPALEVLPGGAEARPFITHHNALDIDLYMRISLELYQKRLLVGGFEKTFEIGRIFRNEGIDAEHLQDYTQMEFYWAYADYVQLMVLTEEMFRYVIKETFGTTIITSHGQKVDWAKPWKQLDYFDAFFDATGLDLHTITIDQLQDKAKELGVRTEKNSGKGRLIDLIYKKTIRPYIIEPTHLVNHPVEVSPLAKRHKVDPAKVERVQTLAYGTELTNGFSELNDPIDQRERFEEQAKLRAAGDDEAMSLDEDFLEALEYGMPPAAGFGMSERVFSYLVDMPMRESVLFPTMRPEVSQTQLQKHPEDIEHTHSIEVEELMRQAEHTPADPASPFLQHDKKEQSVILGSEERVTSESKAGEVSTAADSGQARMTNEGYAVDRQNLMTEGDALTLVDELLQNKNLKNHCYAAGAAMGALFNQFEVEALRQGTTKEDWIITGILHDVDYEVTNKDLEKHTEVTTEKLRELIAQGKSADQIERITEAVLGHCDKAERITLMAKAIYAADELTGLIVAAALIRPDKKLEGLTVESILKRFNEPSFAKGANRDQIRTCENQLDLPLDVFTEIILDAMNSMNTKLGL